VKATSLAASDGRVHSPRFQPDAMAANQRLVDIVEQVAVAKRATAAQIALAWLMARQPFIVPIFGTRQLERVRENLGAAAVSLSPDDMAAIEARLAGIEVVGERLPKPILALSYL
jgi:aryl-alcohol dehydrogenase-like predicted oxidoreductase